MAKIRKTFVVNRAKWVSGSNSPAATGKVGKGESGLLNSQGYRCCLGFVAVQCGVRLKYIAGRPMPGDVDETKRTNLFSEVLSPHPGVDSVLATCASGINDDTDQEAYRTPRERERDLQELFRDHGYRIKFTGKYRKST